MTTKVATPRTADWNSLLAKLETAKADQENVPTIFALSQKKLLEPSVRLVPKDEIPLTREIYQAACRTLNCAKNLFTGASQPIEQLERSRAEIMRAAENLTLTFLDWRDEEVNGPSEDDIADEPKYYNQAMEVVKKIDTVWASAKSLAAAKK